jgi:hypothetical protein
VSKRGFFVVAIFAAAAILIAALSLSGPGEKLRTISGRITSIDTNSRTASLEFVHPKTGETLRLHGQVPLDCDIRIDDRPATLAELQPGERVEVEGIVHRDRTLSAIRVRVSRSAGSSSKPAAERTESGQPATIRPSSSQAAPKP